MAARPSCGIGGVGSTSDELLSTDVFEIFLLTFAGSTVSPQIVLRRSIREVMMALKKAVTSVLWRQDDVPGVRVQPRWEARVMTVLSEATDLGMELRLQAR